ncbi:MAG: hypothetical protein AAF550_06490 [Myxococcota bacterium]
MEGGIQIAQLNRLLGASRYALPTSGAGNGHRLAGCVATGTHGAAYQFGAVHDALRAVVLVVAPDRALFIQPAQATCKPELIQMLSAAVGMQLVDVRDDMQFEATRVSLGALGFVFGYLLEAVPLYQLRRRIRHFEQSDGTLATAMVQTEPKLLFPEEPTAPYHFEVVLDPYGSLDSKTAYVVAHWKEPVGADVPFQTPNPVPPDMASDHLGLIGKLMQHIPSPIDGLVAKKVIYSQIRSRYPEGGRASRFPGQVFGPTGLPRRKGTSTEIVVNATDVLRALGAVRHVLRDLDKDGVYLLGAIAIRFVKGSSALLGMNITDVNAYIELPSIRNEDVEEIVFPRCFDRLRDEQIRFTCHWGQVHDLQRPDLLRYFGRRVGDWSAVRRQLLTQSGLVTFTNPTVRELGL